MEHQNSDIKEKGEHRCDRMREGLRVAMSTSILTGELAEWCVFSDVEDYPSLDDINFCPFCGDELK